MAYPTIYSVTYSYTGFQQAQQGISAFPGTQLDADLAGLHDSVSTLALFMTGALRSDGQLQNGIVTFDSLSASLQTNGLAPAVAWATATPFKAGNSVVQGVNLYRALIAHTSGVFATDLAAGKWLLVAALPTGPTGPPGTIAVHSTTTLAPGAPATVVNVGSGTAASLDFGIPQGVAGPTGPTGSGYGGTSITSLLIANTVTKVFATQAGLAYQVGNYVRASSAANGTNYMEGIVSAYAGTSLSIDVKAIGGAGTFADWALGMAGSPGVGVASIGGQVGALTIAGGALSSTIIPVPRYDAAQTLALLPTAQVQANIGLPAVHRRPIQPFMKKWGAGRLNVLQGTSNTTILCVGDSTTVGAGVANPLYPTAWPTVIASIFTAAGLNASAQSRICDGANGASLAAADPRVVMGGSYVITGVPGLAGVLFGNGGTISTPWKFLPTANVTHFDVYTILNAGNGSLKIDINGGTATTLNENASDAVVKTTISAALGANTLNITPVSGATHFIGAIAYNSAAKEVSVINCGVNGATASTFSANVNTWNSIGFIGTLAPSLTIIDLTINDAIAGTALSTYVTALKAVAVAAAVSGDVLWLGGVPIQTSSATLAAQTAVNNAMAATAASRGENYISMFDLWQSRTAIIAAGYDAGDGVHVLAAAYAAMAAQLAPHLL